MPIVSANRWGEGNVIKRHGGFVLVLALLAPAAFAQQSSTRPSIDKIQLQQNMQRREAHYGKDAALSNRQAERDSLTNLTKLRAGLAKAWQGMGLPPQTAQRVADSYDPTLASQMHHTSLRGKTDAEVAGLLQSALAANHYLVADQLLIDYQRQKLSLAELKTGDVNQGLSGK
jgi:hypothetical protein